jgi:hypothetical protein
MELFAFIAVTGLLCAFQAWRKKFTHAIAFGVICASLCMMIFLRGDPIDGVVAFAVWTLVSHAVLMFPLASILFLLSAFCYILELQGNYAYAIQVTSNLLGLAGVLAVWYGTPKWKYRLENGIGLGSIIFMGGNAPSSSSVVAQAVERTDK